LWLTSQISRDDDEQAYAVTSIAHLEKWEELNLGIVIHLYKMVSGKVQVDFKIQILNTLKKSKTHSNLP